MVTNTTLAGIRSSHLNMKMPLLQDRFVGVAGLVVAVLVGLPFLKSKLRPGAAS